MRKARVTLGSNLGTGAMPNGNECGQGAGTVMGVSTAEVQQASGGLPMVVRASKRTNPALRELLNNEYAGGMRNIFWITLLLASHSVLAGNLVENGDFSTGALAPATTTYTFGEMGSPESWIITNLDTGNSNWQDFPDHTTGDETGAFMVLNGSTADGGPAYSYALEVPAAASYVYSVWLATVFPSAQVELRVYEGEALLEVRRIDLNPAVGLWEFYSLPFSTTKGGVLSLEVWDTNGEFFGNDYALDDVELHATNVQEAPWPLWAAAALAAGLCAAGTRPRTRVVYSNRMDS